MFRELLIVVGVMVAGYGTCCAIRSLESISFHGEPLSAWGDVKATPYDPSEPVTPVNAAHRAE